MTERRYDLTKFMDVVRIRRSVRKYTDTPIEQETIDYLCHVARQGGRSLGTQSPFLLFVVDPETKQKLSRAIFSGWFGKVNPWILTTKAPGFVVACGHPHRAPTIGDKHLYLAEAAMIMELVVLAAAEVGLGTCWLGGFGEEGVKKALGLNEETRIVAISPLGYPPEKISRSSWDYLAGNLVSKRRVDISKIVSIVGK